MGPIELTSPEEVVDRLKSIECTCDPSVGWICEPCHDRQVLQRLITDRDKLLHAVKIAYGAMRSSQLARFEYTVRILETAIAQAGRAES